jgi:GT2 family glycosyltransferase
LGDGSGRLWYAGGHFDTRRFVPVHWGWLRTESQFPATTPITFATGCSLLIHRRVFEAVGLFDDGFFLYWEDVEFSQRVQAASLSMAYVPDAWIWHDVGASSQATNGASPTSHYYSTRNRLWYLRSMPASKRVLPVLWTIPYCSREVVRILFKQGPRRMRRLTALVRGSWHGVVTAAPVQTTAAALKAKVA